LDLSLVKLSLSPSLWKTIFVFSLSIQYEKNRSSPQ
jgi:hypothetical protein